MVTPSRLLPDLVGERGVEASEEGHRRVLVDRMRLIAREDGTLERATELFPPGGRVESRPLPGRLGGGYLFHATGGSGTQIWRSSTWLGKLTPIVQVPTQASDVVPGFDRLYVRLQSSHQLRAFDVQTGEPRGLAPLPPAASYGSLVFVDGWRAVVDVDLRGALATFDAGATWRPLGIKERFEYNGIGEANGDPIINVPGGQYTVDGRGTLTYRPNEPPGGSGAQDETTPALRPAGPLGRRPLRAVAEDGWPDSPTTAVVARGGVLARVGLRDGRVLETVEDAYRDRQASCHAVRLGDAARGPGFGFVCGERDGPTVIYEMVPPLSLREVLRFDKPRHVAASGNGALVIRGACDDGAAMVGDTRAYCIRSARGVTREIRVRSQGNDLGVERVVALSDGRVAVLVPPRPGAAGQLTLLAGSSQSSVPLTLPVAPKADARELRRGMWLEGFEEREPGVLGGWIEAGGPVIGVRVALDGKVTAGEMREPGSEGGAVLSGRFGVVLGQVGRAAETVDGGRTWRDFDLPDRETDPADAPTRACGPVGCALRGWIRVGWGEPGVPRDLALAATPNPPNAPLRKPGTIGFDCTSLGSTGPAAPAATAKASPEPKPPKPTPAAPPSSAVKRPPPRPGSARPVLIAPAATRSGWQPFRNVPPPALGADEIGFDNGTTNETVAMRAYAWGKKGADWSRAGRWLIRFDDRFEPGGGVRSSAPTPSPWREEAHASEYMGGYAPWQVYLDPSGRAALVASCRGQQCTLDTAVEGQPMMRLRDAQTPAGQSSYFSRALGAVRMGESWFFLTQSPGSPFELTLWRSDLGAVRSIATLPRPRTQGGYLAAPPPQLVRRASGAGVGLLVVARLEASDGSDAWYVLPIDPEEGTLGDPIALGRRDLGGVPPLPCEARQDGWQVDTSFGSAPYLELVDGRGNLGSIEARLRLDPGAVCLDGLAAVIDGTFTKEGAKRPSKPDAKAPAAGGRSVSLAATEKGTGRRWAFRCTARGGAAASE